MERPQGSARSLTILDLPYELLYQVFQSFQHLRLKDKGMVNWGYYSKEEGRIRRQTIQSARLVCRHFNRLASPLLCPIVRVNLDQESLDNAVQILQHPLIASGVRGIELGLHYRPTPLAVDIGRFKNHCMKRLRKFERDCTYHTEFLSDSEIVHEIPGSPSVRVLREAANNTWPILSAWNSYIANLDNNNTNANSDPLSLVYQDILRRAYEEYRQRHEEQVRLIETGSFVKTLSSSICRLQRAAPALAFVDDPNNMYERRDPIPALTNKNKLFELMVSPQDWTTIEGLGDEEVDLLPARILSELPVALHKAGSQVHEIFVGCFPLERGFSKILPPFQGPQSPELWSDLRAACQALRVFSFGKKLNNQPIREHHPAPEDQFYIDQYLAANLSGKNLEFVYIGIRAFGLNDGRTTKDDFPYLGSILRTIEWPRAQDVTVMYHATNEDDLESFCAGLGYSLKRLYLCGIQLRSGSYAGMLEKLRERLQHRRREGACWLRFTSFTGGEFGKKKAERASRYSPFFSLSSSGSDSGSDALGEPLSLTVAEQYVSGYGEENPCKHYQVAKSHP